jgi:hypothetical protein
MPEEYKKILQLCLELSTCDWYLYQGYTIIHVYGCKLEPYFLPMYIPSQFFSLEYFRKKLSYRLHFVSKRQKSSFALPYQVFSLIVKHRYTFDTISKSILSLDLKKEDAWKYDPNQIISKQCSTTNSAPYVNHSKPEIENSANKDTL